MTKSALLVVDAQNDFFPGGALAVPNGNEIIRPLNSMIEFAVTRDGWHVYGSRDWHPADHCSFKEFGGQWPSHCVQNTHGAELHSDLIIKPALLISKGYSRDEEAYSLFAGAYIRHNDWPISAPTLLRPFRELYVAGLATDYCVKATCLDGVKLGFRVYLLTDACRAVNLKPTDEADALQEMWQAGVIFTTTDEIIHDFNPS